MHTTALKQQSTTQDVCDTSRSDNTSVIFADIGTLQVREKDQMGKKIPPEETGILLNIGDRIEAFQQATAMNATMFCKKLKCSRSTFFRIKAGTTSLSISRLVVISSILGITIDELISPMR